MTTADLEDEVERPRAGLWPWGRRARLARAAKILKLGRFDEASARYQAEWDRLIANPKTPAELLGAAAVGLAVCLYRQGRDDDLLSVCREARKSGIAANLLLDLPCSVHLKRRRIPAAADFQDILSWLSQQGARASIVSESDVERLLRGSLRPWLGTGKGVTLAGEWLRAIAKVRPRWGWPEIHLAEWARGQKRFADAAAALGRARAQAKGHGGDAALLWAEAECLFLAGDKRKAAAASDVAWKAGPLHEAHAALAIESSIYLKAVDEAVGRLQLAFGRFGATVALCEAAHRVAAALGCWQQLRPVIETATAPSDVAHVQAIGLLLRAAAALQDRKLADTAMARARASGVSLTGVEAELATLLRTAAPSGSPTPRVKLVAQALGRTGPPLSPQELSVAAGARPASAWARLAAEVEIRQFLASRRYAEAGERAQSAVRSADPAALDPLLMAGVARAFAAGELAPAIRLVEACSDPNARLWLSGSLLAQAASGWGSPGGRSRLTEVAAQLAAAQKLAALPAEVAVFAASVNALATRSAGGQPPPLVAHVGLVPACLAVAGGEKGAAESAMQVLANGSRKLPIEQWLEKATARLLLARGDWQTAFALCRIVSGAREKLLDHLGATAWATAFASAFDAAAAGQVEEAFDLGIKALAASSASPEAVVATAELAVALRQARGEAALTAVRPKLYQAVEAALAARGERPTCPRWEPLAVAGLWSLAAEALIGQLVGRVPSWHELATLAVLAAAAGREAGILKAEDEARAGITLSAGAFMALWLDDRALVVRAAARIRAYEVEVDTPRIDVLRRALTSQTYDLLSGLASTCGIEPDQLEMLLAIERAGAEGLAKAGQALAKNGGKVPPTLGPLLLSALGLRDSLEGVFAAVPSGGDGMADLFRQLATFLGQEGLSAEDLGISLPGGSKSDPAIVRAQRLYSPLAPIVVLVGQKRFATALSLLKTVVDSKSLAPVAKLVGSPADGELAAYVSADRRQAFFEGARNFLIEVALEECRDLVAEQAPDLTALNKRLCEILALARAVDRGEPLANGLSKLIVGRAVELFQNRTRENRIGDEDKRSNSVRQKEAVAVLRCGLDVLAKETSEIRSPIEGKLAMCLNVLAVKAGNAGDFKEAERLLLESLEINPANRAAAGNLVQVVMVQALCAVEGKPLPGSTKATEHPLVPLKAPDFDSAFKTIMNARKRMLSLALRLRDALSDAQTAQGRPTLRNADAEIFRMLEELGKQASTPFFNASLAAKRAGNYTLAATRMIEASLVGPDDADTEQGLMMLSFDLISNGRFPELERVRKHIAEERHGPKPEQRVEALNREAIRLAGGGRFADALAKLRQAEDIVPGLPALQQNRRDIAQAWCEAARRRGDVMAVAEAERELAPPRAEIPAGSPA